MKISKYKLILSQSISYEIISKIQFVLNVVDKIFLTRFNDNWLRGCKFSVTQSTDTGNNFYNSTTNFLPNSYIEFFAVNIFLESNIFSFVVLTTFIFLNVVKYIHIYRIYPYIPFNPFLIYCVFNKLYSPLVTFTIVSYYSVVVSVLFHFIAPSPGHCHQVSHEQIRQHFTITIFFHAF